MKTADYAKVTAFGGDGSEIPRFSCFIATIPTGRNALVIDALDVDTWNNEPLFETALPDGLDRAGCFSAAILIAEREGFRLWGRGWTRTDRGFEARLEVVYP